MGKPLIRSSLTSCSMYQLTCSQGENFHRSPKAWFKSTSKKFIRKELSMHERRRTRLKHAKYRLLTHGKSVKAEELREQRLASRNPDIHHYIGTSKNAPIYLSQFSPSSDGSLSADVACSVIAFTFSNGMDKMRLMMHT